MWRFAHSENLIFLWLIPGLWLFDWVIKKYFFRKIQKHFNPDVFNFLTISKDPNKEIWQKIFISLAIFFLVLALSRPQSGQSKTEIKSEGVEIMLVVDVSDSMMAEDLRPSRLEQAKNELSKLVDLMGGHKVGLLAFAGSAHLQSPLTNDPSALKMYIDSLATNSVSSQGTNFTTALEESEQAFLRGGVGDSNLKNSDTETAKVTRVVVIASDGEDQEPGALEAAKKISNNGIHIFTIAYGTEKGAPIPERDNMGFLRGYKKDKSGNTVLTSVKGQMLQQIAQAGQGQFYFASFGGTYMKDLVAEIDKLEKTQFESQIATQYKEQYQFFLIIGLLMAIAYSSLNLRRNLTDYFKHHWRGRFTTNVKTNTPNYEKQNSKLNLKQNLKQNSKLNIIIFFAINLILFANTPLGRAGGLSETSNSESWWDNAAAVYQNNKGIENLLKDNFLESEKYFLKALKSLNLSVPVLNNLGINYLKQGLPDKAILAFSEALKKAENPMEQFILNFNLGVVNQLGKKTKEAVQFYRQALNIDSTSKELKTNIELLLNNNGSEGQGDKDNQDQKNNSKSNNKDEKNKNDKSQDKDKDNNQDSNKNEDSSDPNNKDSKNDKSKDENKNYQPNKPQPKKFESKDLSQGDVNKILGELKQQEQKIRAEFNKREVKEKPKDKDW